MLRNFAVRKEIRRIMYYEEDREKLGFEEFRNYFYDNLSTLVTNREHILRNKDFYEQFIWKAFEKYNNSRTGEYGVKAILTVFEITLHSLFKFQPETELPEDLLNLV